MLARLLCRIRGHVAREQPWPSLPNGVPYALTDQAFALAQGWECFEVCERCGMRRWRPYQLGAA